MKRIMLVTVGLSIRLALYMFLALKSFSPASPLVGMELCTLHMTRVLVFQLLRECSNSSQHQLNHFGVKF